MEQNKPVIHRFIRINGVHDFFILLFLTLVFIIFRKRTQPLSNTVAIDHEVFLSNHNSGKDR